MSGRRALAALVALGALLALPLAPRPADGAPAQTGATMELAAQSPLAERGSIFVVRVRLTGVPDDGSIALDLHRPVRSRSELDASTRGEGLRGFLLSTVTPLTALPPQPDGTRRLILSLDPEVGGVPLAAAGVYPLVLTAQDAAENEVATLVTHLIVPPDAEDGSPPLNVALVAQVDAPAALQPDGSTELDRAALGDVAGLVGAVRDAPEVPLSLAVTPETVDALAAGDEPGDPEVVDALRAATADRAVLDRPYVDVSLDALSAGGLDSELAQQLRRGRQLLTDALGQAPTTASWLADPDLGAAGLTTLAALGVQHVVVRPDQVAPVPDGLLDLSLAHRFSLAPPAGDPGAAPANVDAIALDPVVLGRLEGEGTPALVASRVLTELAVLWFEQPGVPRGVVLPVGADLDPLVVAALLDGLAAGRVFAPVTLDELFGATSPLTDAGGNVIARALTPGASPAIASPDAAAIRAARSALETFTEVVGLDSPRADPLAQQLLLATAADLTAEQRRAHREAVTSAIDDVLDDVSGPDRFTLTLTARDGTIPLTLRNDSGVPLRVVVHLESPKLDFPDGTEIAVTLTEPSTRLDIPVEARASGAFPLDIEVTSPDGQRRLVMSRYTVRSTAVAGAGLVLSVGAGLFLVVWWARHWRRTRRSARLVSTTAHPAAKAQ